MFWPPSNQNPDFTTLQVETTPNYFDKLQLQLCSWDCIYICLSRNRIKKPIWLMNQRTYQTLLLRLYICILSNRTKKSDLDDS